MLKYRVILEYDQAEIQSYWDAPNQPPPLSWDEARQKVIEHVKNWIAEKRNIQISTRLLEMMNRRTEETYFTLPRRIWCPLSN